MRVTKTLLLNNLSTNIGKLYSKIQKNQTQISEGRRLLVPSDDPVSTNRLLSVRTAISKNEQYQRNLVNIQGWLETTESTLNNIQDLLTEIDVIANRSATDTYGNDERHRFAEEINHHLERLVQFSKKTYNGRYIFAGHQTTTAPFATSNEVENESFTAQADSKVDLAHVHIKNGSITVKSTNGSTIFQEDADYTIDYENGTITVLNSGSMSDGQSYAIDYQTDSISTVTQISKSIGDKVTRQIGENLTMDINVPGDELFINKGNMYNLLIDLRNKIERDDTDGIKALVDDIKTALDHVTVLTGEVGAKNNRILTANEYLEKENIMLQQHRSNEEDVDFAEAIMKYETLSMAYQAALQSSSEITKLSIMNFL